MFKCVKVELSNMYIITDTESKPKAANKKIND